MLRSHPARQSTAVANPAGFQSRGRRQLSLRPGVDAVLLDNMTPEQMREAVRRVGGRAVTEASGRITVANANAIAATGVDIISAGWLTHSAPILDLGLDAG